MPNPWEEYQQGTPVEAAPWESYGYSPIQADEGKPEKIYNEPTGEMINAPAGTAQFFADIQADDVFDVEPSSVWQETGAMFEKQAAYIALIAGAYDLVPDDSLADFVADRSAALAKAQANQPEYMKEFNSRWENASGFFESTGVILSSPRAIGRQVITQAANSSIPLLTTLGGTVGGGAAGSAVPVIGTAAGGVTGGVAGAFVGGSLVEVGAQIDSLMQEAGYDMSNSEQVLEALSNPDLMADIKTKAEKKGLTTAAVDALFQVVGGRFVKMAKGASGAKKVGMAAADVGTQALGEGTGELAGTYVAFGEIDFKDAALEAITSLSQSVGQTAIGATVQTGQKALSKVETAQQKLDLTDEQIEVMSPEELNGYAQELDIAEQEYVDIAMAGEAQIEAIAAQDEQALFDEAQTIKTELSAFGAFDESKPVSMKKSLGYTPVSLSQFIKNNGGITDAGGELSNRGVTGKTLPALIRKPKEQIVGQLDIEGMPQERRAADNIDQMKERVFDAGYFPDKNDYNEISDSEFFDAIANDAQGDRVYTQEDRDAIAEKVGASGDLIKQYDEAGITADMSQREIAEALREYRKADIEVNEGAPIFADKEPEFVQEVNRKAEAVKEEEYVFASPVKESDVSRIAKDFGIGVEKVITPISTRIKNISPKLFVRIRRYESDVKKAILSDNQQIVPLIRKMKALPSHAKATLDLAMKNRDIATINMIADQYGMRAEIEAVRPVFDGIYDRAMQAGMEFEYLENHFPRKIKDYDGLMDHLRKDEGAWNVIKEAIKKKEEVLNRTLSQEEKATVVDNLLLGRKVEGISLAKKGIFKGRTIKQVTNELNQYYADAEDAMLSYIHIANEAIETNKLFGRKGNVGFATDPKESIGEMVNDMVERDGISNKDARQLEEMLNARFNPKRMSSAMASVRDAGYIATMGSPLNAITQIGDLATSMYNAGIVNTITVLPAALRDKTKINLADIGIEDIAQEFDNQNTTAAAVDRVFKMTGLSKIDRVGKLTLINSALKDFQKKAKANDAELMAKLEMMFEGDAQQVMNDLAAGNITDDVKFLTFNTLLDFQPVARSEMPEMYLRAGNGKIFYMLKSFTLKQVDAYRRESFALIREGMETGNKTKVIKGMKNFAHLASLWIVMGASADWMKDFVRSFFGGSEMEEPEDYVIENMYKAFGLSKYTFDQMNRPWGGSTPTDAAFDLILPPTKTLDNMWRDYKKIQKNGFKDLEDLRTIRSIPLGGELYWFWLGGGADNKKSDDKKGGRNF